MARVDELLQHEDWLRRFVTRLVQDPGAAADVAQETMLVALRQGPRPGRMRGFLAGVASRLVRMDWRAQSRRRRHEARVGERSAKAVPSTSEMLDRLETRQLVSRAVAELPEPDRTTVLLRYVEGLSPTEIAHRLHVAPGTIRQRCHRGLQRVRDRLQHELGSDWRSHAGLLALLGPRLPAPIVRPRPPLEPVGLLLGTLMNQARWIVVAGLVIGAGIAISAMIGSDTVTPNDPVEQDVAADGAPAVADRPANGPVDAAAELRREGVASPPDGPAAAGSVVARVEAFWRDGSPAAGIAIGLVEGPVESSTRPVAAPQGAVTPLGTTDRAGAIECTLPAVAGRLVAVAPEYALSHTSGVDGGRSPRRPLRVVVGRTRAVRGIVVDPQLRPLSGVEIGVEIGPLLEFPKPLEDSIQVRGERTVTNELGVFEVAALAAGARLRFELAGYRPRILPVDAALPSEVVLQPLGTGVRLITGVVTDQRLSPVVGARVELLHGPSTKSDAYGAFELDVSRAQLNGSSRLYAAFPGYRPVVVEDVADRLAEPGGGRIELMLGLPAVTLKGRLLEADGSPAPAGLVLYPWDRPAVGWAQTHDELAVDPAREPLKLAGPELRSFGRTNERGEFEIPGLERDADYQLRVFDRSRFFGWTSPTIRVGDQPVELRLPAARFRERLEGVVVDRSGQGIAGVKVGLSVEVMRSDGSTNWMGDSLAKTDSKGRFVVEGVPRTGLRLTVSGRDIVGTGIDVPPEHPAKGVRMQVARRCYLRVIAAEGSELDAFSVLDDEGKRLSLTIKRSGVSTSTTRTSLQAGRSIVLAVAETGTTAVFFGPDGKEASRLPVRLVPGEVVEVRP